MAEGTHFRGPGFPPLTVIFQFPAMVWATSVLLRDGPPSHARRHWIICLCPDVNIHMSKSYINRHRSEVVRWHEVEISEVAPNVNGSSGGHGAAKLGARG